MTQLTFLDSPLSRPTDPVTSAIAAAEVAPKLGTLQARFAAVFEYPANYKMTAAEAALLCVTVFGGLAESYRKRAAECVRLGLLRVSGVRTCGVTGKRAQTYERTTK